MMKHTLILFILLISFQKTYSENLYFELPLYTENGFQVNNDSVTTDMNQPVSISLLENDIDTISNLNISTLQITIPPSYGTVIVDTTGKVVYTPNTEFVGKDIFRYQVCNNDTTGVPLCGEGLVFITVLESTVTSITGQKKPSEINTRFKIFPNPNNGIFTVDIQDITSNLIILEIFDNSGRIVRNQNYTVTNNKFSKNINISDEKSGIYHLKVHDENISFSKSIIITEK